MCLLGRVAYPESRGDLLADVAGEDFPVDRHALAIGAGTLGRRGRGLLAQRGADGPAHEDVPLGYAGLALQVDQLIAPARGRDDGLDGRFHRWAK